MGWYNFWLASISKDFTKDEDEIEIEICLNGTVLCIIFQLTIV